MTLPLALANLGLINEFEFVVHPVVAGHGPYLLAGLRGRLQLDLVQRQDLTSGAVAYRYCVARQRQLSSPADGADAIRGHELR